MKRGPYRNSKRGLAAGKPKNFFKKEHEHAELFITWADATVRKNNQISILYKIAGNKKQFRTPRSKSVWLDEYSLEYAKKIAQDWKNKNT